MTRACVSLLCALSGSAVLAAQTPPDVNALLARVGERVADYYRRAEHVICTERATVEPVGRDWMPVGLARTVESELRIEADTSDGDGTSDPKIVRTIRSVNRRPPRPRDKTDRSACTDPTPFSAEPLSFLLPAHRDQYRFTHVRSGRERERAALIVDFESANRTTKLVLVKDAGGHDDCFDWTGPVAVRGRVWVDAATFDVLRVERRLAAMTDVRVPWDLQRKYGLGPWVTLERDDETLRYVPVAFRDPDEILVLPESTESMILLRGGLESTRRTWRFTDYRRFVTSGRIVKDP
jgi:hypothetical protein